MDLVITCAPFLAPNPRGNIGFFTVGVFPVGKGIWDSKRVERREGGIPLPPMDFRAVCLVRAMVLCALWFGQRLLGAEKELELVLICPRIRFSICFFFQPRASSGGLDEALI